MKARPPEPTRYSRQHPELANRNTKPTTPLLDRKSPTASGKGL